MVHVVVHVEVTVLCDFCTYNSRFNLRIQNIHHLGERVLAWNQGNRVRRVFQIFGFAGFQVYQKPRRCRLRNGVPLGVEDGVVFKTNFVHKDVLRPCGDGKLLATDRVVQQTNFQARDDRCVARLHHFPEAESVLFGIGNGGFFHEQEEV